MNDAYSQKILEALQEDSRMTVQQISERVGLSPTPCWKRIKEMESQGVITGYTVRVDRKKVGLGLMVLAEINVTQHTEKAVAEFEAAVQATPQIVRCYSTTGPSDYVLTITAQDIEAYEHFLMQTLFKLPAVAHVRSSIVLRDIKQGAGLPL
ncbi:AsnC family transcriptional regulator [Limnohabitans sp. T6-5]|uniref:Lrp/AsnC family transcriptional regulator n=1 Tax=Limnohabitans sp. T6-5 TaxID=1100724 RepID=UPI000D354731|nr:Lrp/AsnC family transcriptional regulator [Limnohabitans sp. T6-5]PUE06786.1 AsnC family transcriptional regulator [Limnohabitans sp. T6-5]